VIKLSACARVVVRRVGYIAYAAHVNNAGDPEELQRDVA